MVPEQRLVTIRLWETQSVLIAQTASLRSASGDGSYHGWHRLGSGGMGM